MSLTKKILLIVSACYLFMAVVLWICSDRVTDHYRRLHCERIAATLQTSSEIVYGMQEQIGLNVQDMANAAQGIFSLPKSQWEEKFKALLKQNSETFTMPLGCDIVMIPGVDGVKDSRWFTYLGRNADGSDYWVTIENQPKDFDYTKRTWYQDAIAHFRDGDKPVAWSAPYNDAYTEDTIMVTASCAIHAPGKPGEKDVLLGVAALDWSINELIDELQSVNRYAGSYMMLVDNKHNQVVASTIEEGALGDEAPGVGKPASDWLTRLQAIPHEKYADAHRLKLNQEEDYLIFHSSVTSDYVLLNFVNYDEMVRPIIEEVRNAVATLFILVIASYIVVIAISRKYISNPLTRLMRSVKQLGAGDMTVEFDVTRRDEIGELGQTFNRMVSNLMHHMAELQHETARRERMSSELSVATQIQKDLLPSAFPAFPNRNEFEIYASMHPARGVGGDFYDFALLDDDHLYFAVADVSGKGIPAALFMMCSRTIMRNNALGGFPPEEILARTNVALCENNRSNMFLTTLLGVLELSTGKLTVANAGHNPPLICKKGRCNYLKLRPGFILGGMENLKFRTHDFQLEPGDAFYCYTDGVTEAQNTASELFGEDRLALSLAAAGNRSADGLIKSVDRSVANFVGAAEQADDITQLCIVWHGPNKG